MQRSKWSTATGAILMASGLLLSGCAETPAEAGAASAGPATVEVVEGSEVGRVTLTQRAATRLDLRTAAVTEEVVSPRPGTAAASAVRKVIPYGAVMYDNDGITWAYTVAEPLTFVREPIAIDYIYGDRVVLVDGPAIGAQVVTLGAAELYGAELGLGQ